MRKDVCGEYGRVRMREEEFERLRLRRLRTTEKVYEKTEWKRVRNTKSRYLMKEPELPIKLVIMFHLLSCSPNYYFRTPLLIMYYNAIHNVIRVDNREN